ncbi:Set1 complex component ash2 [Spathaspora sp. JA1]|nr:Set1 complex component ash2 [Spathaspora sp. JA1]
MSDLTPEASEEPSIEPQVQGPVDSPAPIESSSHSYSTRSKQRAEQDEQELKSKLKQKQHNVVVYPRLKPIPFKQSDLANSLATPSLSEVTTINNITFYQCEDLPINKRGFKYKSCKPNPEFQSNLYSTTEIPPYQVCIDLFDRSSGIIFDKELTTVSTLQGWRSGRTNVGIREGKFYFEFEIVNSGENSHVRIGLARREASLEAPVGFDAYSYGIRDITGEFITTSRRKTIVVDQGFKTGDVIGFLVELPRLQEHKQAMNEFVEQAKNNTPKDPVTKKRKTTTKKAENLQENATFNIHDNIIRDQIPIRYKNSLYYEQFEYTSTKTMDHLLNPITVFGEKAVLENDDKTKSIPIIPNSKITIFKNGIEQKNPIKDLYSFLPTNLEHTDDYLTVSANLNQQQNPNYRNSDDGTLGYYPMLSTFQHGAVKLNPGPDFKYPPSTATTVKPLCSRYEEVVVEEWLWDIIDEVEAEYLDSFE